MVEGNEKLVELTKDLIVSEYHMTNGTFRGMLLRGFVGELRRRTGIDMDLFNEFIPDIKFAQFVWDGSQDNSGSCWTCELQNDRDIYSCLYKNSQQDKTTDLNFLLIFVSEKYTHEVVG